MKRVLNHLLLSTKYLSRKNFGLDRSHLLQTVQFESPPQVQVITQKQHVRYESTNNLPDRNELQHGVYEMKDPTSEDQVVNIKIFNKDGKEYNLRGKIGDNLLYLAKRFEVEMEGACEASLACTTCHVYVDNEFCDKLDPASEKEEDLLDMAPFLKENSRLGCQIILRENLRGLKVTLPAATKNFYVDGHKPTSH